MTSPDVPETPEEQGIPDYADDTSTAYEPERPTLSDSPAPLAPGDENVETPGRRGLAAEEEAMHEVSEDELSGEP